MALEQVHRIGHRRSRFGTPSRRRRVRVGIVVGLFLGFVALAWAWAFQRGPAEAGSGIRVLAADPQPTREKPSDPGGMKVADIDPLSYDSGRSPPKIENILPGPEKALPQPIPEQRASTAPPKAIPVADDATVGPPLKLVPDISPPTAKPAAAVAPAPPPPAVKPLPKPKPAAVHVEPKPQPRPAPARPTESGPSGYRLQLASLRSAADARATEARLKGNFGDLLGSMGFSVVAVNLGDRGTYYRVMAGPMSQGAASQLCETLRQRGAACILAKP
jgi:cell division septation protein DedD